MQEGPTCIMFTLDVTCEMILKFDLSMVDSDSLGLGGTRTWLLQPEPIGTDRNRANELRSFQAKEAKPRGMPQTPASPPDLPCPTPLPAGYVVGLMHKG